MSKKIKNLIAYILNQEKKNYETAESILNILYLADWKSAIERNGKTISSLDYKIHNNKITSDSYFKVLTHLLNHHGEKLDFDHISNIIVGKPHLTDSDYLAHIEKSYIDFVVNFLHHKKVDPNAAIQGTYPVFSFSNEDENLNLSMLAKDYIENIRPKLKENA